jgi:hypothetical protein
MYVESVGASSWASHVTFFSLQVEYQCLSNTDSRVSDLLIQVRRGRQVDISSHVRKTFTVKERLPTSCRYF